MKQRTALLILAIFCALVAEIAAQSTPINNPRLTGTTNVNGNFIYNANASNSFDIKAPGLSASVLYVSSGGSLSIYDVGGFLSIDAENKLLSTFGQPTIDWAARTLQNSGGLNSVSWEANMLANAVGATVLNWETMIAIDAMGINSVEWNARTLRDSTGTESADWENRRLSLAGVNVVDWNTLALTDAFGISSIQWSGRVIYDSAGTPSIDWSNREVFDAAEVMSLAYGGRALYNSSAEQVLLWDDGPTKGVRIPNLLIPYQSRSNRTIGLTGFTLKRTISSITGVSSGISGATYNARTGTLFLVRNVSAAAGTIYETTLDGTVLRTITNSNFIDTEAVEWIGSFTNATGTTYDILCVAEEDHTTVANEASLTLCLLAVGATTLDRTATNGTDPDNVTVTTAYSNGTIANLGIESVCYDPFRSKVYYTAENRTQAGSNNTVYASGLGQQFIFQRTITANATTLSFGAESTLCSILALSNTVATGTLYNAGSPTTPYDVSDMSFDIQADSILLQSDTGDRVIRIGLDGTFKDWIATPGNQPEGLAMHPDGDLMFVVGEAQEFFVYGFGNNPRQFTSVLTQTQTLDFPSTLATAVSDLTITVTGAAAGDGVIVAPPSGSVTATAVFFGYVSATNTVTVRFSPKATEDPASGVFRVTVIKN